MDITNSNLRFKSIPFKLVSDFPPAGDQAQAIEELVSGINNGESSQVLKGVTGSGKTFTVASVIEKINKPTLILSHNKTLAAQLYREFKSFFPHNAVEYFVSTYDYYQPEAYVPGKDLYIEKETDINDEIDRLRLSASFSLMERSDVIVVSTVSCIYGLGNPMSVKDMIHTYNIGDSFDHKKDLDKLVRMLYDRNDAVLTRGCFRCRGENIEIYPAHLESAFRLELDWDQIAAITFFDPISGEKLEKVDSVTLYPAKQFVMPEDQLKGAIKRIQNELDDQLAYFNANGKLLEAQRLESRVNYDIEMLLEVGHCSGIENYSRPISGRAAGERPAVLLDYFPKDFICFIDESHVTLPQIGAMYEGDKARKTNLVNYGFRLPSALDNRPLKYAEFDEIVKQRVYVSATPGKIETSECKHFVNQLIRPTGLLDPIIEVKSTEGQMEDLFSQIKMVSERKERVLVTTLTKRMAEDLTAYLANLKVKVRYLHSEVDTIERVKILKELRMGVFDVLIGINLLREGLDLPEVSLVAILDADKIGFLRSATSLIQTIGRAARNSEGRVIMYADRISDAMQIAISETEYRREMQEAYNRENNITPKTIKKAIQDIIDIDIDNAKETQKVELKIEKAAFDLETPQGIKKYIKHLEKEMREKANNLEFEKAMIIRDEIQTLINKS